jgi:hypothetical protein
MENCVAINCRNGASFTGTGAISYDVRVSGLTIRMGTGSDVGLLIDDCRSGVFTGITIDGGNNPPEATSTPGAYMSAQSAIALIGSSQHNHVQAVVQNMYAGPIGGTQSDPDFRGRALRVGGDAEYNHIELSTVNDCGLIPLLFDSACNHNLVEVGLWDDWDGLPNSFGLQDIHEGASDNFMRYRRGSTFALIPPVNGPALT